jgi:hypothetical protein
MFLAVELSYVRQKLIKLQKVSDEFSIIIGNFHIPLSEMY